MKYEMVAKTINGTRVDCGDLHSSALYIMYCVNLYNVYCFVHAIALEVGGWKMIGAD